MASSPEALTVAPILDIMTLSPLKALIISLPVIASIRLTPLATDVSAIILNRPACAVLVRWVPPQNSVEKSGTVTTLTIFPYFSPNKAIAPRFWASSMGSSSVTTGTAFKISSFTIFSTCVISSKVIALK